MMWFPNSANARLREDAQLRTLYGCLGVSLALHGLAMFALPGWRPEVHPDDARVLTALFALRSEPAIAASESVRSKPRERRAAEPLVPPQKLLDPAPVAEPEAAGPAPAPSAAASPSAASSAPERATTEVPANSLPEAHDVNLLEAYRLALIDAARRYKRYPAQAMERGWEGRVEIRVVVGANGMIKSALVKRSSRYQILDDQALDMVRRAFDSLTQPAPRGREFTVDVPVIFELQTG